MPKEAPLLKIFQNLSGQTYAYDGLTNRIITIHCDFFRDLPEEEREAAIRAHLTEAGTVSDAAFEQVTWPYRYEEWLEEVAHGVPKLLLQTTCRCNLDCSYCIYSGNYSHMRPHANQDMTREVMRRSIDFYAAHNVRAPEADVSFYGGEALLRFDLIRDGVAYARSVIRDKPLRFHISSNGLLLSRAFASWLTENPDVMVTVTLNGPFQDEHRKTPSGEGSLETIMANIRMLQQEFPDVWKHQVELLANLSSVFQIPVLRQFYLDHVHKPPYSVTGIESSRGNQVIADIVSVDAEAERAFGDRLKKVYCKTGDPFLNAHFWQALDTIHNRPIYDGHNPAYIGGCLPLLIKMYVYVDGRLGICESSCDKIVLGDVEHGIDEDKLRQLYEQTRQLFDRRCRTCWAQRLCTVCYKHLLDDNGKLLTDIPQDLCETTRRSTESLLAMYCEMARRYPGVFRKLFSKET